MRFVEEGRGFIGRLARRFRQGIDKAGGGE